MAIIDNWDVETCRNKLERIEKWMEGLNHRDYC